MVSIKVKHLRHILLIGANSLVGRHISLLAKDIDDIVIHSLLKGQKVDEICHSDFELVIFLAQSPDYKQNVLSRDMIDVNISLLRDTLEWSRTKTKSFINFSTGSVYKPTENGHYTTESELNFESTNPYVISKLAGEMILNSFREEFDFAVNVRPFFIYGEGQKPDFLIPKMIRQLKAGNQITLNGGKGLVFNPLPAVDCARMLVNPLIHKSGFEDWNANINLSGEDTTSLGEMLSHLVTIKRLNPDLLIKNTNAPNYFINDEVDIKLGEERTPWQDFVNLIYYAEE